jgi:hypothetical protein
MLKLNQILEGVANSGIWDIDTALSCVGILNSIYEDMEGI